MRDEGDGPACPRGFELKPIDPVAEIRIQGPPRLLSTNLCHLSRRKPRDGEAGIPPACLAALA